MSEREIFLAVLELPVTARTEYLDKVCGADASLRNRVDALLDSHEGAGSFLGTPAVVPSDPESAATRTLGSEGGTGTDDEVPLGFLAPPTRPDSLGRIGHYEVLQVLGQGGFGIVFRGFDDVLQRVVAVKVLAPQLAATSPARKRFLREARTSAQVRHENVVQVHEVGETPLPYLVMEFIPGETLQQRLDRIGPIEPAEVVRIGRQIAEGLAAAHANDLIHRDIKPGNILLEGGAGRVKITDFGLARAADDASISQSGIIAGTPMYMAPEQAKGDKLDQRADLFSLGSVLYQMASGRSPFRANSTVAVLKRVAEDTPRAIREIIPETPQWLCDIIAKLHAKSPDDRFQSAREVADVLADCEQQLKAHRELRDYTLIPRGLPEAEPESPGIERWMWLVAAVAGMLLLPVVIYSLLQTTGGSDTALVQGVHGPGDDGRPPNQQAAIAPFKLGDPEYANSLGMKFKLIPAGKFTMGSPQEEIDRCLKQLEGADLWVKKTLATEGPEHLVEITQPFYLGATEVTVGQFRQFVDEQGYQVGDARWRNPGFDQTDQHPAVWVSWQNAVDFCNWLSAKEGKTYRLPTEAEWEYCCRAGKAGSRYCFGGDDAQLENYAWFNKNSRGGTHPVGKKKPNDWGLYDMHGNAWEWCQDCYDPDYYKSSPVKDPPGGVRGERVFRGGSWRNDVVACRSAFHLYYAPDRRTDDFGFRVLLVSPPAGVGTESGAKNKPAVPAIAPFTDADVQRIAALPAVEQVEEVRKELMRRNPGFDGKMETRIEGGVVTEFRIVTDQVTDIAPIQVFNSLRVLDLGGTHTNYHPNGQLADLSPLKGMNLTALTKLNLNLTKVGDVGLVHFKDCTNLTDLGLGATRVSDNGLAYFKNCKGLTSLELFYTPASDAGLANFKDCKGLTRLNLVGTKVSDAGLANFKDCKNLTTLSLDRTQVGDAGMVHFQDCKSLTDLGLAETKVSDVGLANFKDCKGLMHLGLGYTKVGDVGLANFKDCKNLNDLWLHDTQVGDAGLAQLKGIPLRALSIDNTGITDLTPLQGMPLEHIRLTPKNITKGLDILRDMKSLKTIGITSQQSWPAAEFWERYGKGEFK